MFSKSYLTMYGLQMLNKEIQNRCRCGLNGEDKIAKDLYEKYKYIVLAEKTGDPIYSNHLDIFGVNSLKNLPKVPCLIWNTKRAYKEEFKAEINVVIHHRAAVMESLAA